MGASFDSDNNIVDPENSTTTPLGSFAEFVGTFKNVTNFSSVTITILSDVKSDFSGIQIEWSTDGVTADLAPQRFTFDPTVVSQDGLTVHATVRAKFCRVRYLNGFLAQTFLTLTTLLRRGTPAGTVRSIDPVNTFLTNLDVEVVQSILSGRGRFNAEQLFLLSTDDISVPTDGPFVFVSPRPGTEGFLSRKVTPASTSPIQLTNFAFDRQCFYEITNDVLRGNLYMRVGDSTGLSATSYDFKIPPGHTWTEPTNFGTSIVQHIFGVWDEVAVPNGNAVLVVKRYG